MWTKEVPDKALWYVGQSALFHLVSSWPVHSICERRTHNISPHTPTPLHTYVHTAYLPHPHTPPLHTYVHTTYLTQPPHPTRHTSLAPTPHPSIRMYTQHTSLTPHTPTHVYMISSSYTHMSSIVLHTHLTCGIYCAYRRKHCYVGGEGSTLVERILQQQTRKCSTANGSSPNSKCLYTACVG